MPANFNNFTHSTTPAPTDRLVGYANTQPGGERSFPVGAFVLPPGMIMAYAGQNPPPGWLPCDGRSTSGFPALAALVGSTVPDLRGYFIRGAGTNADGTTSGAPGQKQADEVKSHSHNVNNQTGVGPQWIAFSRGDLNPPAASDQTGYPDGGNGKYSAQSNDRIFSIVATGGTETRPKNIPFLYIIKT